MQTSCNAQTTTKKTIRINPGAAIGGNLSQFVEEVTYIPLENTKESKISDIIQLEMSTDYYVILDKKNPYIFVFLKNGDFYNRISTKNPIHQFSFNKVKNTIEFESYPNIYTYDIAGKLINTEIDKIAPHSMFGVSKMNLDKNYTAYFNTSIRISPDSTTYELLICKNDSILNRFLPYPKKYKMEPLDNFGFKNFILEHKADTSIIYYIRNFDYCVYELKPNALIPLYEFVFPIQYSLPNSFSMLEMKESKMEFFDKNEQLIPRLFGFYKDGNLLYFHTGKNPFLYDLTTQRLINLNQIKEDSISYNLPISSIEKETSTLAFLNFNGKYFYASIPPQILFNKKNKTKKAKKYPSNIDSFFKNKKNAFGNPVLIQIKFKQKI